MRADLRRELTSGGRRIADEPETRLCRRKDAAIEVELAVLLDLPAEAGIEKVGALPPSRGEDHDVCRDRLSGVELDFCRPAESPDPRALGDHFSPSQRREE